MRKIVLAAAMAGTALTLFACSESAEDVAVEGGLAQPDADASGIGVEDTAGAVSNANTATAEELTRTDRVSADLAQSIVAGRPYASVVDLHARLRETLSEEAAAAVLAGVFVPVNLNTASTEEIELIPGMSDRMVGEFLEYRPYEDMNEFDREIGKYVDEAEVARLRNYVTL